MKLNPFGAFVELDQDIHGLAHISELSYRKLNAPSEVVTIGDVYEFKIISIEPGKHRLGLSYKALHEQKPDDKPEDKTDVKTNSEPVVEAIQELPLPKTNPRP